MKIRVSTDRSTARIATLTRLSFQASTQAGIGARLGLQDRTSLSGSPSPTARLIGDDRLGTTLAKRVIMAGEGLQVRDLVVEPERNRHRRSARRH